MPTTAPAPTKYPPGATLQCPCGKTGSVASVTGHLGRTTNPICRSVEKLMVVGQAPVATAVVSAPLHPSTAPPEFPTAEQSGTVSEFDDRFENEDPFPQESFEGAYAVEPPRPHQDRTRTAPGQSSSGKPKGRAVQRGEEILEFRQPSQSRGPLSLVGPQPPMIRSQVELPVKIHALYDAARADPDLGFEGTMSDFIADCIEGFFEAIGYEGIKLVKRGRSFHAPVGY